MQPQRFPERLFPSSHPQKAIGDARPSMHRPFSYGQGPYARTHDDVVLGYSRRIGCASRAYPLGRSSDALHITGSLADRRLLRVHVSWGTSPDTAYIAMNLRPGHIWHMKPSRHTNARRTSPSQDLLPVAISKRPFLRLRSPLPNNRQERED